MPTRESPPGYRERAYTSQDGLRLYYRDYGDRLSPKTPILCLAGLTRNSADFHPIAQRLAAGRRVVCPDYRGRGRSDHDADWRRYNPVTYVNDVRHLLAAAGLHRVAIIGTSMGGILAAFMAVAMPAAVAGVVLNDVGPEVDAVGLSRIIAYISEDRPQPDWETAAQHLRDILPDPAHHDAEGWIRVARATYREGDDGLLHFDWDTNLVKPLIKGGYATGDFWPAFRALRRVPLLVVRGGKSDVLSEATLGRMADRLPGLAQVTVPGVGHVPSLSEPEAVEAIDALVART